MPDDSPLDRLHLMTGYVAVALTSVLVRKGVVQANDLIADLEAEALHSSASPLAFQAIEEAIELVRMIGVTHRTG